MAKVTISDVAREAGVALGTVSNALNHPEKVRPETLQIIKDAIEKLGYAPNQSARMLAGGHNQSFGLVLPSFEHGISLQIANGANAEARKHGYGLLIANADNDDIQSDRYLRYFMGTQMAGIMIQVMGAPGWKPPRLPAIPAVYLDAQSDQPGYFVAADNVEQGQLVAKHAIESGARHVVALGACGFAKLERRVVGIKQTMESYPDIQFEFVDKGSWNLARDGYHLGRELAERPASDRPDFIVALTDVLATGVIAGVQAAGPSVPLDIKVAGCDGNPLSWNGPIPLTTIAPPGYEIGRKGVQYLIRQIEQKRRTAHDRPIDNHQELIRPFLLARASTGACAVDDFANTELDISGYL